MQVISCQWLLDVQLFNFHNPRNAEKRETDSSGTVDCCCDGACAPPGQFASNCGLQICDIFFNVELSECQQPSNCFISTRVETINNSPTTSSYGYIFSFTLNSIPEDVS